MVCKPNSGSLKTYIERCEFAGGAANFDRFGREADVANCAPPFYGTDAGFPDAYCVAKFQSSDESQWWLDKHGLHLLAVNSRSLRKICFLTPASSS